MLNKFLLVVFVFAFSISINANQFISASLSGLQHVPLVNTTNNGVCTGGVSPTGIGINCQYSNLSSNAQNMRIHLGGIAGQNAPIYFASGITGGGTSGSFSYVGVFNNNEYAKFVANEFYVVITTLNNPEGEIRGQLHISNNTYNDFDGDSRTDLTVYRNSNNTFYALQSANNSLIQKQIGQAGDSVSLTVDFDYDGKSDFSTARYNSEIVWRIFKSSTNTLEETNWGSSTFGDFFAANDYNGDGVYDITVYRAGVWYILDGRNATISYQYFGQAGDIPAPNDFDGDGRLDLAVARSESGQRVWHIRRGSDGVYYSIPWGLSSDAFFTGRADWDGDGKADISVIRNESGQRVFYILRSSDLQLQLIRWGLSSDVVKLGDYDGDGRTDAAVTRAANGQRIFYILQSSNGAPRYETFGLAGDF